MTPSKMKCFILIISFCVLDVTSYCLGGNDPICYFPDPNEPRDKREEVENLWTSLLNENDLQDLTRSIRDDDPASSDPAPDPASAQPDPASSPAETPTETPAGTVESSTPEPEAEDSPEADDESSSLTAKNDKRPGSHLELDEIITRSQKFDAVDKYAKKDDELEIVALMDPKKMKQPKLKRYPSQSKSKDWTYPPFTYHGYFSPKDWHKIPKWYFLPVVESKLGKFTKTVVTPKSGISFMTFKTLSKPTVHHKTLRKNNADEEDVGGVSSINCSNSLFPAPLDIITSNAHEEQSFMEFDFGNYDMLYSFVMFIPEDGTDLLFVKLQTPPKLVSVKPSIEKGAVIGDALFLDRILIHYGTTHMEGSEHRINGKSYGMELQFFFNIQDKSGETPYWQTLENYVMDKDASQYGRNLIVISVLVEVGNSTEKAPPSGKEYNKGMKYLASTAESFWTIRNLGKFRSYAATKKVLKMSDFFHVPGKGIYYTYYGCLTHPPCLNNTRYAVYETPIYMSHKDWRKFLFIPSEFSDSSYIAGNFRPMDIMTFTNNWTNTVVSYDNAAKANLSYTVKKSRKTSAKERLAEYDYYEDQYDIPGTKHKKH